MSVRDDRDGDRKVLILIGGGIFLLIETIILCLAFAKGMPDWSESVMAAIVGGALVKLADLLSALVTLSGSREREKLTDQLSQSTPNSQAPQPVEVVNADPIAVEAS